MKRGLQTFSRAEIEDVRSWKGERLWEMVWGWKLRLFNYSLLRLSDKQSQPGRRRILIVHFYDFLVKAVHSSRWAVDFYSHLFEKLTHA